MRSARWAHLLGTALAATLTGCSVGEAGTPQPTSQPPADSPSTTPTESAKAPAPRVADPLDATRYFSVPCSVLATRQVAQFNISEPGKPHTDGVLGENAPSCTWTSDHEPIFWTIAVGFLKGNENGLGSIYANPEVWKGYFEPTSVDGYPAVFNDAIDSRPNGSCVLTLGVSDSLAVILDVYGGKRLGTGACAQAEKLASAVITTLKGA